MHLNEHFLSESNDIIHPSFDDLFSVFFNRVEEVTERHEEDILLELENAKHVRVIEFIHKQLVLLKLVIFPEHVTTPVLISN